MERKPNSKLKSTAVRSLLCLVLVCSSCLLRAQTTYPIETKAYADSLRWSPDGLKDSARLKVSGSYNYYGYAVGYRIKNNLVEFQGPLSRRVVLEGYFSGNIGFSWASAGPELQNEYVQGEPVNGKLSWQGPEKGVPYSFGPGINQLAFDHGNYAYDKQGQLVASGSGGAAPYDNRLDRTALSNQQTLYTRWSVQNARLDKLIFSIRATRRQDPFVFPHTNNRLNSLESGLQWTGGKWALSHHFIINDGKMANANNYGFLNTVYRNQLLTPVSFDNSQGYLMPGGNRFFAAGFSHPLYMLEVENHASNYFEHHQYIQAAYKSVRLDFELTPAFTEENRLDDLDHSRHYQREQITRRQRLQAKGSLKLNPGYNFILNMRSLVEHDRTDYDYSYQNDYRVTRFFQDHGLALQFTNYHKLPFEVAAGNNFYASSTAGFKGFSPHAKLKLGTFHPGAFTLDFRYEVGTSWQEPDVTVSRALSSYRLYSIEAIPSYLPNLEVTRYDSVNPSRTWHHEWSSQIGWKKLRFGASYSRSRVNDQYYAVMQGNVLHMENLSNELHQSLTLGLDYNTYGRKFKSTTRVSFYRERETVLSLHQAGGVIAIGGFREVYTGLVAGQTPGVVMGSAIRRNSEGLVMIGNDGFPLVDQDVVIGNPLPQFNMNFSQTLDFKAFSVSYSLTWSKGGQFWDGTEAVLDYYGRSAASAIARNLHQVVFDGVDASGHENIRSVDLLDPSQSLAASWFQRYGPGGIASRYIKPADQIRLNDIGLSYRFIKVFQSHSITVSAGLTNVVIWSKSGNRNLNHLFADDATFRSLNLFNLPNTQSFLLGFKFQL